MSKEKRAFKAALARAGSKLLSAPERVKYDDAQPRDDRGRWTSSGGAAVGPSSGGLIPTSHVSYGGKEVGRIEQHSPNGFWAYQPPKPQDIRERFRDHPLGSAFRASDPASGPYATADAAANALIPRDAAMDLKDLEQQDVARGLQMMADRKSLFEISAETGRTKEWLRSRGISGGRTA